MKDEVTTKYKLDISDFKKNITDANKAMKLSNAEFKAATAGMDKWSGSATGLSAKLKQLEGNIAAQKSKLTSYRGELEATERAQQENARRAEEAKTKYKEAAAQYGENSKEAKKYKTALNQIEKEQMRNGKAADDLRIKVLNQEAAVKTTEREIGRYRNQLEQSSVKVKIFGKEIDLAGTKAQKFAQKAGGIAKKGLVTLGAAATAMGAAAIKSFTEVDDGADNVIRATGATGKSAKELEKIYKEVAGSVTGDFASIGDTVGEVNTRFDFTGEKLKEASQDFMKFANITGVDAKTGVQLVSRAMGDAGIKADEYKTVLDMLSVAAQKSGISVETLTEDITKYGAPMRQLGFDTKTSIALFSQWEKAGVNTQIAFSGMKKAISNWMKSGKDAKTEFSKTMKGIQDGTISVSEAMDIFGIKAGTDMVDAIKEGRFNFEGFTKALENSKGALDSTYNGVIDGADKFEMTVKRVKIKAGELGEQLIETFGPVVIAGIEKASGAIDWINNNTGKSIAIFSTLAGVLGTVFVVSKIVSFATTISTTIAEITNLITKMRTAAATTGILQGAFSLLGGGTAAAVLGIGALTGGLIAYVVATRKGKKETDQTIIQADKLIGQHEKLQKELEKTDKKKKESMESTEEEGIKTQNLFNRLKELMGVEHKSAAQKQRIKDLVNELNEKVPDLNLHYQEEKDKLDQSNKSIQEKIDATKELMRVKATEKNMEKTMGQISSIEAEQAQLKKQKKDLKKELDDAKAAAEAAEKKQGNKSKYTKEGQEAEKARAKADKLNLKWGEVDRTIKKNEKSLKKYYEQYDNLDDYKIGEKAKADLSSLAEKYKKEGMKIPTAISDGIKSGETKPKKAAEQAANLMSFEKAVKKAGIDGKKIPEAVTIAVANGSVKAKTAVDKMQDGIKFEKMVKDAGINGKKIPEKIMAEVLNGKKKPEKAAKEVIRNANKASEKEAKKSKAGKEKSNKDAKDIKAGKGKTEKAAKDNLKGANSSSEKEAKKSKTGTVFGNKVISGIDKKKGGISKAAKDAAKEGKKGFESVDPSTSGNNFVQGFINGMSTGSILGAVFTAAFNVGKKAHSGLKKGQKEGSPSKLTTQSGKYFGQGFVNGIAALGKAAIKTAGELGNGTVAALNKSLDEHSASKKTKKSGSYFAQGLKLGITKAGKAAIKAAGKLGASSIKALAKAMSGEEKTIVSVMKDQIANVVKIAKNYTAGKFTEAGEAAGEAFSTAIERSMQTAQKKVAYIFEQQNQKYDKQLTNLQNKKKNDKNIKKLDSLEKKELAALKKSKKYKKASKKKRKDMVDDVEEKYKKKRKKLTKPYDDAIKDLKKKQKAFATASEETLSAFTEGMSEFASKAEQMVSDTINGITEKYQARWDELESLQESIITKLQGFGDLFTVSGAGVMTINDIKQQTEDIKAYMGSLNNIKGKVSEELFEQIASYDVEQGKAFMDQLLNMSDEELKAYDNAYTEKMRLSEQLTKNMFQNDFAQIGKEYQSAIDQAFKDMKPKLEQLGKECMQGFISGLKGDTSFLSGQIQSITNSIINSFKGELKIHSPSKIFENLGIFSIQGYVNGFVDKMAQLKKSMIQSIPIKEIGKITGKIPAASIEQIKGVKGSAEGKVINQTFNQYNNSPKPINRFEVWRQTNNLLAYSKA